MLTQRLKQLSLKWTIIISALILCILTFSTTQLHVKVLSPEPKWTPPRPTNIANIERALIIPTIDPVTIQWLQHETIANMNFSVFLYCMSRGTSRPVCHEPHTREGREASAYMSYIVDHYDELPLYSVFIHDNVDQWHNGVLGDKQWNTLRNIRFEAADALGYVNLRCDFEPGCPADFKPLEAEVDAGLIADGNNRARFARHFETIFDVGRDEVPEEIGEVCCGQFMISRAQIRARPKSDYERMMRWLVETDEDSFTKGWIFEKTWHMVFGKDAIYCPRYEQCRCDVFGWCGPLPGGETLQPA